MSVHKRRYGSGKTVWFYQFALPGATRQERKRIIETGFATKKEAGDAETKRRIEEQQNRDLNKVGACIAAPPPRRYRRSCRSSLRIMSMKTWHPKPSSDTTSKRHTST
jgi:hypothetical protein